MSSNVEPSRYWRGRIGGLIRDRQPDDPELIEAQRQMAVLSLERHISAVLTKSPALTEEQFQRLRDLLRSDGLHGNGGRS
jgi:hypothetical protein